MLLVSILPNVIEHYVTFFKNCIKCTYRLTEKLWNTESKVAVYHRMAVLMAVLNYSSFIGQITSGMLIRHEHIECISQAISDLNKLLRCRSGCTGSCHSECSGACSYSCYGSTHHRGSCSYMTWWCPRDCNDSCSGGCSGYCDGSCGMSCSNYCVFNCKNSSISSSNRLSGTYVSV